MPQTFQLSVSIISKTFFKLFCFSEAEICASKCNSFDTHIQWLLEVTGKQEIPKCKGVHISLIYVQNCLCMSNQHTYGNLINKNKENWGKWRGRVKWSWNGRERGRGVVEAEGKGERRKTLAHTPRRIICDLKLGIQFSSVHSSKHHYH